MNERIESRGETEEGDLQPSRARLSDYAYASAACLATTLLATPLRDLFDLANIVMLFLLTVVLVAVRLGRGPAVAAAFLSVASFDFFFVPPRFSFAVSDAQYTLTFAVMLTVALITGQLTARLRLEAHAASGRERRARALYGMARDLSGALTVEQAADIAHRFIHDTLAANTKLYLPTSTGELKEAGGTAGISDGITARFAHLVFQSGKAVGPGSPDIEHMPILFLPLSAPMRVRGVMTVTLGKSPLLPEQRQLLETVASLVAIVIERLHYVEVAQEALLRVESERLRNALLSAVSHDLRTPLTALVGLSDSLAMTGESLPLNMKETAEAIRDEALRMSRLVSNLLDMARLQAGDVRLRKDWQPLEEIVGSSLKHVETLLQGRSVRIALMPGLPLLEFDAVLIERVLCNLIENAAKFTPADGQVTIEARRRDDFVVISVSDNGPGLVPGSEITIFEKFMRGQPESANAGVGLGLAICRSIVEAHGGRIWAENRSEGGARFVFTLPIGEPPTVDDMLMARIEGEVS
jgi:two-component system sensor histidine kinase KdpD